jgi:thioredoxin 1
MSSGKFIDADGADLKREISQDKVVLVDFWASWCAPCRAMAPLFNRLSAEFPNVQILKVDAEAHKSLLEEYDVRSLPTIQIYSSGKQIEKLQGKVPYTLMQRALQNVA